MRFRKGTRIRVTQDTGQCGEHGVEVGMTGTIDETFDGKPHDGNADMWREDGAQYFRVALDDGKSADLWCDEIKRL